MALQDDNFSKGITLSEIRFSFNKCFRNVPGSSPQDIGRGVQITVYVNDDISVCKFSNFLSIIPQPGVKCVSLFMFIINLPGCCFMVMTYIFLINWLNGNFYNL